MSPFFPLSALFPFHLLLSFFSLYLLPLSSFSSPSVLLFPSYLSLFALLSLSFFFLSSPFFSFSLSFVGHPSLLYLFFLLFIFHFPSSSPLFSLPSLILSLSLCPQLFYFILLSFCLPSLLFHLFLFFFPSSPFFSPSSFSLLSFPLFFCLSFLFSLLFFSPFLLLLSSICSFSFLSSPFLLLPISSSPLLPLHPPLFHSFLLRLSLLSCSSLSLSLFPFYLLLSFPLSFPLSLSSPSPSFLLHFSSLLPPIFLSLSLSSTTCLYIRYTVAILCLIIYTIYNLIIDVVFLLSFSHI